MSFLTAWLSWKKISATCEVAWRVLRMWVTLIYEVILYFSWSYKTSITLLCVSLPVSSLFSGAWISEEATARAGGQVCVRSESVHHCGQLQLLRCRGLSDWGQRTGKSLCGCTICFCRPDKTTDTCRYRRWKLASHFLWAQLFLHALLTSSVTFLGKLTAGVKCFSFLLQHHWYFMGQSACSCVRNKSETMNRGRGSVVV